MGLRVKSMDDETLKKTWVDFIASGNEESRAALAKYYLPLVKYVAGRIAVNLPPSVLMEDLVSEGIIGLMNTIDRFDPGRGVVFETYARSRIYGAIMDQLRSLDWFPRSLRQKAKKVEEATSRLESRHGRVVTPEEVAEDLNIPVKEVDSLMSNVLCVSFCSLNSEMDKGEGNKAIQLLERIEDKTSVNPLDSIEEEETIQNLTEAIKQLPRQEKLIIMLYYHERLTLKEIGALLNLSESRISQIHSRAVSKLRLKLKKYQDSGKLVAIAC